MANVIISYLLGSRVQNSPTSIDLADHDAVCHTLEAQGWLLGQHDQLLSDIWASLQTLNGSIMALLTPRWTEQAPPTPPTKTLRAASPVVTATPREPHVPIPEQYSGEADTCASFLLQCSLVFDLQPLTYPSDRAKIAFVVNLLSGRVAPRWSLRTRHLLPPAFWHSRPS